MANTLLSTFYVQVTSETSTTPVVDAKMQVRPSGSSSGWENNNTNFAIVIGDSDDEKRYKIDVYLKEEEDTSEDKPFATAGTKSFRLHVTFDGMGAIDRMIYITVQPKVRVYREKDGETQEDIFITEYKNTASNPANYTTEYKETTNSNKISLAKDNYSGNIFVEGNFPLDVTGNNTNGTADSTLELNKVVSGGLIIDDIFVMRNYNGSDWDRPSVINNTISLVNSWQTVSILPLEFTKTPYALEISGESLFYILGKSVARYTGTGTATEQKDYSISIPLIATLTMPHELALYPDVLTLDEDNSFTSFITVETNAGWKFSSVPSQLEVTPSIGTGRTVVVVVKKKDSVNLAIPSLTTVTLSAESTGQTPKLTDSTEVRLDKCNETTNALIPLKTSADADTLPAWQSFDQTLSDYAVVGTWATGKTIDFETPEKNHADFPSIAVTLDGLHCVRSWSLQ
jgi:hypothetical protein